MDYEAFKRDPLPIQPGWIYEVKPGVTAKSIASDLQALGLLNKPIYLRVLAREYQLAKKIKTGEFEIPPGITPKGFLDKLVSGKVVQYPLTVVEGWTFKQFMEAVRRHDKLTHTLGAISEADIMVAVGRAEEHPEGRFLPDTYSFPKGMTDVEFLKRAYGAMQHYLQQEWPQRAPGLPLDSPYQALILASIVEKETGVPSERPAIAGVFVQRLQKGMRLQTDPTVIYGLGARYDGNIHKRDLVDDNPYNTYRIKGLPPTPIGLPGKEAISATLHPARGNALYFVARGDGSHAFADSLEEHNRNVMKYQIKPNATRPGTAQRVPVRPAR